MVESSPQTNRIDALDILRGFALCGLMFMNIEWFNRPLTEFDTWDQSLSGIDYAVAWLIRCLIEGKFYLLFSLLFGMGFAIMLERAKANETPFVAMFIRRMIGLFIFGVLHLVFVWEGDILQSYAVSGVLFLGLILFLKKDFPEQTHQPTLYLKIALWWLSIPLVLAVMAGLVFGSAIDTTDINDTMHDQVVTDSSIDNKAQNEIEILSKGSFIEVTSFRIDRAISTIGYAPFLGLLQFVPIFLLGYYLIVSGVMRNLHQNQHQQLFSLLFKLGLSVGIVFTVAATFIRNEPADSQTVSSYMNGYALGTAGQYFLTAGYFGLIMRLLSTQKWHQRLQFLAPYGKLALSNYLSQCFVLSMIFYGYGLGWYGEVSRTSQVGLAVVILLVQIPLSRLYLKYFTQGPTEWLWRCITYKKH